MTKAEQRKLFIDLRDLCKNPQIEQISNKVYSKSDEYARTYDVLEKTGNLDVKYADHLEGKDGYELASKPDKLTFKECCTVLTFLLRAEHWSDGAFTEALMDGSVYKVLARAVETM